MRVPSRGCTSSRLRAGKLHNVTLDGYAAWHADLSAYATTQRFGALSVAPEPWRADQAAKTRAALQRHGGGAGTLPEWPKFDAQAECKPEEFWSRWWRHQDNVHVAYGQMAQYDPAARELAGV